MSLHLDSPRVDQPGKPDQSKRHFLVERVRGIRPPVILARRPSRRARVVPAWLINGYQAANAGDLAAAVAYNALMAMIPMLLLFVSIGGFALQTDRLLRLFIHAVLWALPQQQSQDALVALLEARRNSGWFAILSLLGFAWIGSNFVASLGRGMNRIYGVPNRKFVHQRTRAFVVILVFAFFFLMATVAATIPSLFVGKELSVFFDAWVLAQTRFQALSYGVAVVAALGLFTVVYRIVPNAGQTMRTIWPGILTAAILFVLLLQAFPIYIRIVGNANRYGQFFGFIPLIVGWFYLLSHVLLFGTYVNATYQRHCDKRISTAGISLPNCDDDENERREATDGRREE